MLASMNLNIPVGTSDAGSYFNNQILEAVDYGVRFLLWKRWTSFSLQFYRWQMSTRGLETCRLTMLLHGPTRSSRLMTSLLPRRSPTSLRCTSPKRDGRQ